MWYIVYIFEIHTKLNYRSLFIPRKVSAESQTESHLELPYLANRNIGCSALSVTLRKFATLSRLPVFHT